MPLQFIYIEPCYNKTILSNIKCNGVLYYNMPFIHTFQNIFGKQFILFEQRFFLVLSEFNSENGNQIFFWNEVVRYLKFIRHTILNTDRVVRTTILSSENFRVS